MTPLQGSGEFFQKQMKKATENVLKVEVDDFSFLLFKTVYKACSEFMSVHRNLLPFPKMSLWNPNVNLTPDYLAKAHFQKKASLRRMRKK
jgi:hypothetical protein